MDRQKQNYRIGFPIASIYIVLSYALTGLGPTYRINRKLRAQFKAFNNLCCSDFSKIPPNVC